MIKVFLTAISKITLFEWFYLALSVSSIFLALSALLGFHEPSVRSVSITAYSALSMSCMAYLVARK